MHSYKVRLARKVLKVPLFKEFKVVRELQELKEH
jgi:hypothetical protein